MLQQHTGETHGDIIKRLRTSGGKTNKHSITAEFGAQRLDVLGAFADRYFLPGVIHDINPVPLCLNITSNGFMSMYQTSK